jgi:hypothetical protein
VVVERASAGRYWLLISDGEDLGLHERINLRPTDDWHYMFPVGGAHRLRISVDRNAALPSDTYFAVALPHPARPGYVVTAPMNPERVFEVASPHVGGFQAEIFARNGSTIASANGEIRAEDTLIQVLLDVEAAGQRFRIVGAQGQPVPHVSIRLFSPDGAHQKAVESADERGECLIKGLEPGDYQAYMEHLELGYHFGVPVDVPPPSAEPVEVRFLPEGVVELQLMDGFEPLPALPCYLVGERGFYTLPPATSDSSGIVRWQSVGRGRFLARIRQPGFWPTETTVETRPPGERTEVQVRRLGDLDLQVERASGGAAGGVVLELESAEFAVSVADWITEGKAMSSTGTLAVDSHGQLSLTGLPRGTYRWAAEGASGTVEVLPERRGEFTILLP